jgi:hypothetical protein
MDEEQLEKQLESWKKGLLVALGASVTFFATTLAVTSQVGFWGWYVVWVIIWLAVAPPGFYLLMSRKWRKVPLSKRLNPAFGYLGCAWLILVSAGIKGYFSASPTCTALHVIFTVVLGAGYWVLRKKKDAPEELFP